MLRAQFVGKNHSGVFKICEKMKLVFHVTATNLKIILNPNKFLRMFIHHVILNLKCYYVGVKIHVCDIKNFAAN